MVVITAKSFANSFWVGFICTCFLYHPCIQLSNASFQGRDDVGFEVLTSKMSSGKKTCEELRAFYNLKYVTLVSSSKGWFVCLHQCLHFFNMNCCINTISMLRQSNSTWRSWSEVTKAYTHGHRERWDRVKYHLFRYNFYLALFGIYWQSTRRDSTAPSETY